MGEPADGIESELQQSLTILVAAFRSRTISGMSATLSLKLALRMRQSRFCLQEQESMSCFAMWNCQARWAGFPLLFGFGITTARSR
jgi:hypothetical protein